MAGTGSAEGQAVFGNALLDAPVDPLVPSIIEDAQQVVGDMLDQNRVWAQDGIDAALDAMDSLSHAHFPDTIPDPPPIPSSTASFYSGTGLNFDYAPNLGTLTPLSIEEFNPDAITIPDIASTIPEYVPAVTSLSVPDAPTYDAPAEPDAPVLDLTFDIPEQPVPAYGTPPILDELNLPVYIAPILPTFTGEVPTFDEAAPEPVIQWQEPEYVGQVSDEVQSVLLTMLAGGTGLPIAVETAIWERGRDRESAAASATIQSAREEFASRGFAYPPGRLDAKIISIRDGTYAKLNAASREVMVKQADLEQTNRNFAVTAGINFERLFVDIFLQVVGRNFEIAKFEVETVIKIYDLKIAQFNAERLVFTAQIELYRAQLEGAFAYIKAFEALVSAEKAKADMNIAKIQQYEAEIKAFNSQVEAFTALVKAETAKGEFEKNKVDVYKAQVDAMVGEIQGQKTKFDAYDSRVKGEVAKATLEEANARAYEARVKGIGEQANIAVKQVDAEIAIQRIDLDWATARMQRMLAYGTQELQNIQAKLASFQAINQKAIAKFDADSRSKIAEFQAGVELARVEVARYTALLGQWDARTRQVTAFAQINAESLRAAGQIASNLAAGAMAGTHVSAGISGQAQASQTSQRSAGDSTRRDQSYNENFNRQL